MDIPLASFMSILDAPPSATAVSATTFPLGKTILFVAEAQVVESVETFFHASFR